MATDGRVLLAGASGRTGRQALGQLVPTEWAVRALTRSVSKTDRLRRWGADEVVVGDLMDPDDAHIAVDGVDVVLTAVGSSPAAVLRRQELVDGTGTVNLIEAADEAGVEAIAMVSSLGVGDDRSSWMAKSFRLVIPRVLAAKTRAEAAIRESGLRYAILRPGLLTTRWAPGQLRVADAGTGRWGAVERSDLGRLLVAAPFTPDAADRTLEVAANPLAGVPGSDIDWQPPTVTGQPSSGRLRG